MKISVFASVTKTVAASKNIIAQELGRVIPLVELYRNIGKNKEANVRVVYNSELNQKNLLNFDFLKNVSYERTIYYRYKR